jgi:hypothetical protein
MSINNIYWTAPLPFIQEAFSELYSEDGIVVMAKGLGIHQLLAKFLQLYNRSSYDVDQMHHEDLSMSSSTRGNDDDNKFKRRLVFCINMCGQEEAIHNLLTSEASSPTAISQVLDNLRKVA